MRKSKLTKQVGLRLEDSVDADLTVSATNDDRGKSWQANMILKAYFKKNPPGK